LLAAMLPLLPTGGQADMRTTTTETHCANVP